MHEALGAYGQKTLFCSGFTPFGGFAALTKQILYRAFWHFCLILPHLPHKLYGCLTITPENMRQMREYEDMVFKGFCLFRIEIGVGRRPGERKYEAVMRMYEDDPHIFGSRYAPTRGGYSTTGAVYPTLSFNSTAYSIRFGGRYE